jgi:hypothetical protein
MRKQKQFPPGFNATPFPGLSANRNIFDPAVNPDTGPSRQHKNALP